MVYSHVLPVVVAAIVAFLIGGLWYGPVFGKTLKAAHDLTEAELARYKAGTARLYTTTIVCEAVIALAFAHGLRRIPHTWHTTLVIALGAAIGLVVPTMIVNYGFLMKPAKVLAIDAGHWLVVFVAIALVLVAFRV